MINILNYFDLTEGQLNQFNTYMRLIQEWNKKINLTAITDTDDIILKHFIDSLTISKYIKNESKVIDIGTGAGFPGIPIKIYDSSIDITLLDSLKKRIMFLDEVINLLNLENIITVHGRAEDYARESEIRESFDIATSRAVSNLSTLLEYMLPFIKKGGICICMKGANVYDEINASKNALKILGGRIETVEEFNLPETDMKRNIIIIKKIANTSNKYPRTAGIPGKKPL